MAKKSTRKTKKTEAAGEEPKSKAAEGKPADDAQAKTPRRKQAEAADTKTKGETKSGSRKRKAAQGHDGKTSTAERDEHVTEEGSRSDMEESQSPSQGVETDVKVKEQTPPIDQLADRVASTLFSSLESFTKSHGLGRVAGPMQFDWGKIENQALSPDLAFVSFGRWAPYRHVPWSLTWHVVPDLVVEIVREPEQTEEYNTKLNDYFSAGVNRVWVIHPHELRVLDYQSPSEYLTLDRDQCIDGGTLLPGFQLPLTELVGEAK